MRPKRHFRIASDSIFQGTIFYPVSNLYSSFVACKFLSFLRKCHISIEGSRPAAHCYCGHQFGGFAGQLGDGATMYLGEVMNSNEDRWELQLKGNSIFVKVFTCCDLH